jgi:hypothetical protein
MFTSTLDCAAMSDDKSVLGNLPRSRPGRRSDKRGKTESAGSSAPEAPKPPPAKPRATTTRPKPKPAPEGDPVTDAARATVKVVGAGVRIGTGIAQEVLRRLPRP